MRASQAPEQWKLVLDAVNADDYELANKLAVKYQFATEVHKEKAVDDIRHTPLKGDHVAQSPDGKIYCHEFGAVLSRHLGLSFTYVGSAVSRVGQRGTTVKKGEDEGVEVLEGGIGVKKEQLKERIGELNLVVTEFEADGMCYMDRAVSVTQVYDLIDQLDEPEKLVIPQFVADWWERDDDSVTMYGRLRVEKKHKFDLISIFYDKGLGDYLSKVEDWIYENDSIFLDLVNGKPYEVEKEKLYYVIDKSRKPILTTYEGKVIASVSVSKVERAEELSTPNFKYRLTEKQIKDYDERFWPFAVEVEG